MQCVRLVAIRSWKMVKMYCCSVFHNTTLPLCITEEVADYIIFFCGHVYHNRCAAVKDTVMAFTIFIFLCIVPILYTYVCSLSVVTALLAHDPREVKAPPIRLRSYYGLLRIDDVSEFCVYIVCHSCV